MARLYRLGFWRRSVNRIIRALLRVGLGPPHTYLLMVLGRKSLKPYSTPVTMVEENGGFEKSTAQAQEMKEGALRVL
jgi:hypothetical protein